MIVSSKIGFRGILSCPAATTFASMERSGAFAPWIALGSDAAGHLI